MKLLSLKKNAIPSKALIASAFLALLTPFVCAHAAESASISVQGVGAIEVTPNAYSVTLVVEEQGNTVGKLNTQLDSDLRAIVTFLLEQGIEQKHIQSMQVRLQPRYINTPQGRQQEGFTLSRDITVTSTDLETYDKVLDGVLKRGVDRIQQFNFISVGEGDAYQKALIAAVKNAKQRAHLLAKELEVEVGEVVAISESGGNMPIPVMRAEAFAKDMSMSLPGQERIEARVNVSFKIVQ
ncbi:SIMPL domain-containing protein [Alteromonas mediterranea]|uniref:SIMPL domain-containing protein n=1 Tax=Alteromonas mediterranea TaxID=314275 RepID=UPI002FE14D13